MYACRSRWFTNDAASACLHVSSCERHLTARYFKCMHAASGARRLRCTPHLCMHGVHNGAHRFNIHGSRRLRCTMRLRMHGEHNYWCTPPQHARCTLPEMQPVPMKMFFKHVDGASNCCRIHLGEQLSIHTVPMHILDRNSQLELFAIQSVRSHSIEVLLEQFYIYIYIYLCKLAAGCY